MDLPAGHQSKLPFKDVPWKIQLLVSIALHISLVWMLTAWWKSNDRMMHPTRQVINVELSTRIHPAQELPPVTKIKAKPVKNIPKAQAVQPSPVVRSKAIERPREAVESAIAATQEKPGVGQNEDTPVKNIPKAQAGQPSPVVRSKAIERPKEAVESAMAAIQEKPEIGQNLDNAASTSDESDVGESVDKLESTDSAVEGGRTNDAGVFEKIVNAYKLQIKGLIEREKRYPLTARKGRQQGTVTVVFQLNSFGTLVSSDVARSSGHRLLDRAALKAVRAVGQFPSLPAELSEKTLFQVDIEFTLR